jgi:hypothetical protein
LAFDAVYQTDKCALFTLDTDIDLNDFRMRYEDVMVEHKKLRYQTKGTLNVPASADGELGANTGRLVIHDQRITKAGLRTEYSELIWDGKAAVTAANSSDVPPNINVEGNLDVADLKVDDDSAKLTLAIAKKIAAKDISVAAPNNVDVGELVLTDIKALLQTDANANPAMPEIGLKRGVFNQVKFNNETQSAAVSGIELTDLYAHTSDKKLQLAHVQTLDVAQASIKL